MQAILPGILTINPDTLNDNADIHSPGGAYRALQSIEGTRPVVLAYDGSLEALLTCIFVAFSAKTSVENIACGQSLQLQLGVQVVAVEADMDAARRVQRSIMRSLGTNVWHTLLMACASDDATKGMLVYRFLRSTLTSQRCAPCNLCARKNSCQASCSKIPSNQILDSWDDSDIQPVLALHKQVTNEAERMRQFIRFEHVDQDLWFAHCNPNCSVVPFIMGHFARRLNTQRFVIFDEVHKLAGLSESGRWQLVSLDQVDMPTRAAEEETMQDAWRRFYRALSIDERYHPELRRNFMPKRLWKNITEVQFETK